MTHIRSGPWTLEEIEEYLGDAVIPVRLATGGRDGVPLVQSLWFRYDHDALWCATQQGSVLAKRLAVDDRCGFEVAGDQPPYMGVRGTGRAELLVAPAAQLLDDLLLRYHGTLESAFAGRLRAQSASEVAVRVDELSMVSWDFRQRMTAD